ncbi:MAG: secretin N-terminal domain-containing protein, partial [Gammaproteobacteria bacterium]
MPLVASFIFVDLALFPGYVVAQEMVLEVIPLEHRLSADVIPLLKPLVAPGGTVTGMSSQLIVRSTQRNLLEIKRVLAAIDRPLRRLKIIVRQQTSQ